MSLIDPAFDSLRSDEAIPDGDDVSFAEIAGVGAMSIAMGSEMMGSATVAATAAPPAPPLPPIPPMTIKAASAALDSARRETEKLEEKLNNLVHRSLAAVKATPTNGPGAHRPKTATVLK
jgi:hypothetical protein